MGRRGPTPGSGGRPRKPNKPRTTDGYVPATVGPAGRGHKVLEHQVKAGTVGKGRNVTVDHRNNNTSDNRPANLKVMSRAANTAKRNRRAAHG